jgi:hypothetical protein
MKQNLTPEAAAALAILEKEGYKLTKRQANRKKSELNIALDYLNSQGIYPSNYVDSNGKIHEKKFFIPYICKSDGNWETLNTEELKTVAKKMSFYKYLNLDKSEDDSYQNQVGSYNSVNIIDCCPYRYYGLYCRYSIGSDNSEVKRIFDLHKKFAETIRDMKFNRQMNIHPGNDHTTVVCQQDIFWAKNKGFNSVPTTNIKYVCHNDGKCETVIVIDRKDTPLQGLLSLERLTNLNIFS